jgi:hypothetical protein
MDLLPDLQKRELKLCYALLAEACDELARMHDQEGGQATAESYREQARRWRTKGEALQV